MVLSKNFYDGCSNVDRAYDMIHELFHKKQDDKSTNDHYGEFNYLVKELHHIFSITASVK